MRVYVLVALFLLLTISCKEKNKHIDSKLKVDTDVFYSSSAQSDTVVITAVGDIMLGSNYPLSSRLPKENILEKITPYLKDNAQIIIGNLEGTLFDTGGKPKRCNNPNLCFVFRTPFSYGKYLKQAGFDFLSIANNHISDFGDFGKKATQKSLDSLGILYAGIINQCEYVVKEKKKMRYAFIGAGHNRGLVSIKEYSTIKRIISEVRPKADIIIVMFHGGAEGSSFQHISHKREFYAGEDRGNIIEFAHVCIDAGADLIIGSGPHVTRAVELYKNKFIAYSLGNFATYGKFILSGANGNAPILKIKTDSKGNFISCTVISTFQNINSENGPEIDLENRALKQIQNLTRTDFPTTNLEILDSGEIRIKR